MRRFALPIAVAAVALGFSAPAVADENQRQVRMPCHDAIEIKKQLSRKYDEAPVAFGLQTNGNLLQIYASKDSGTWTVVSTTPAGLSCIVAAGQRWENLPEVEDGPLA